MAAYGYIAHHGIQGQKWGHRNGPPYPLAPGAHSSAEKKKNHGHYSQGVKQDRSGSNTPSGGNRKPASSEYNSQAAMERRFLEEQAKKEKRKKIARAVAVGAGITAAAAAVATLTAVGVAGYAGVSTLKANPDTTNAVLKGIGSMVSGKLGDMKHISDVRKTVLSDTRLKGSAQADMLKTQTGFAKANAARDSASRRADFLKSFKAARTSDKERRGVLPIDLDKEDKQTIINRASKNIRLIKGKENAIVDKFGVDTLNKINSNYKNINKAKSNAANDDYRYKQTHGIRGAINTGKQLYSFGSNVASTGKKVGKGIGTAAGLAGAAMGLTTANRMNQADYQQQYNNYNNNNNNYNRNQQSNRQYSNQNSYSREKAPSYEYYYDKKGKVQRRPK